MSPNKKTPKRDLRLDLYYPTGNQSEKAPVIIQTHGGGWAAGSRQGAAKASFGAVFTQLVARGFCVASVDYRLAWMQRLTPPGRKSSSEPCSSLWTISNKRS